jgi:hypothetical protein
MIMTEMFFEDFKLADRFTSTGVTVTESMIIDFALTYDPQPFHIDAETAAETHFAGLIASGIQTLALGFRTFLQLGIFRACGMGSPVLMNYAGSARSAPATRFNRKPRSSTCGRLGRNRIGGCWCSPSRSCSAAMKF